MTVRSLFVFDVVERCEKSHDTIVTVFAFIIIVYFSLRRTKKKSFSTHGESSERITPNETREKFSGARHFDVKQ